MGKMKESHEHVSLRFITRKRSGPLSPGELHMSTISSPPGHQLPAEAIVVLHPVGFIDPPDSAKPFVDDATAMVQERLAELYRLMATTRRIVQEGVNLQRQGQLVLWTPSLGQEAAQA